MSEFKVGDKVIMGNYPLPQGKGTYYPKTGTTGIVEAIEGIGVTVQWPEGTTKGNDRHQVSADRVTLCPDTPPQKEYTLAEARDIVIRYFEKLSGGRSERGECRDVNCSSCIFGTNKNGLAECTVSALTPEYLFEAEKFLEEPQVDWSKVAADTPILVRENKNDRWKKRHFAYVDEDGIVWAYADGYTSWTCKVKSSWNFARLATEEEINAGRDENV